MPSANKTYSWGIEGAGRIGSFLADKGTRLLLLTVALATASLVFVYPFIDTVSLEDAGDINPAIRFVSQSLIMFVSFGVFFILWLPPRHLKTGQDIFIGAAFLSTGLLTFAHLITCSALLGLFVVAGSELGSYFHMMASVTMAVGLFIAAFIPAQRSARRDESRLMLAALLIYTALAVALAATFAPSFPSLCPHGTEPAPVRYFVEIGMVLILSVAAVRYYQLGRKTGVMTFHYLACAVAIGAYSHLAFSFHEDFYDLFSMVSIALSIGSATVVFVALFITSVIKPYDRVMKAQEQATSRRREAEAATVRAQTYLDFLGHDIANMISPIMSRAEMILESPESTEQQKEEAKKIVEQTQKISSLIGNVRRLASAERIEAEELGSVDLRILIAELETSRRESHPEKRLALTVRLPDEGDVRVLGGRVAEEIVTEVFDNAIKHSGTELVELEVNVMPAESEPAGGYWTIEIIDHGQGIPDHTKMALDVSSRDPKKRWVRGVASGLSVMALVAERMGGRISVEDRVPGDYTKGTKVTVTLPRAT
jgi:signal transduction histidine kinase